MATTTGIKANPDCLKAYQKLQKHDLKWIIYKINDNYSEIEVEESSETADYSVFREKLVNAKSKDKKGNDVIGGRYGVFDFEWDTNGEGMRSKITFIAWVPDDAPQYPRMMYSSTKQGLKAELNLTNVVEIQANDADDIEYDSVMSKVAKGR